MKQIPSLKLLLCLLVLFTSVPGTPDRQSGIEPLGLHHLDPFLREHYPMKAVNFKEYVPYRHHNKEEVNEVLSIADKKLAECKKEPSCNYSKTFETVYYVIPSKIHRYHLAKFEAQLMERHDRSLHPNVFARPPGELIAYPHKNEYIHDKEIYEVAIDPSSSADLPHLEFIPPIMDFGPKPLTIPSARELNITNKGSKIIKITQMYVDTAQLTLHYTKKLPIYLKPGYTLNLTATLTPSIPGSLSAFAYIKTSTNKAFVYKFNALAVDNAYNLNPFIYTSLAIGETVRFPLMIKNPFEDRSLNLTCIRNFDSKLQLTFNPQIRISKLCSSSPEPIIIPPKSRLLIATASYTPVSTAFHFSHVFIICAKILFAVPIISKASASSVMLSPRTLDFGVIPLGSNPHVLEVGIKVRAPVTIEGFFYKPDSNLKFSLSGLDVLPKVFSPSMETIKLGYAAFYAMRPGNYNGKIYLKNNITGVLEFEYKAEMVPEPTLTTKGIEITAGRSGSKPFQAIIGNHTQSIKAVMLAETSRKDFATSLKCAPHLPPYTDISKCVHLTGTNESSVFSLNYNSVSLKRLPANLYVTVAGPQSLHTLPVTVYDTNIYCTYFRFEKATGKKYAVTKPCTEVKEIEVGALGNSVNYFEFNITHSRESAVMFENLSIKDASGACLESIQVENKENLEVGSLKEGIAVKIEPSAVLSIKVVLSLSYCGYTKISELEDGTKLVNEIQYDLDGMRHKTLLLAEYRSGELTISPSSISFVSAMSGPRSYAEIYANSTFKFPITILAASSTDHRIEFSNIARTIHPGSRMRLARIAFDPYKLEGEEKVVALEVGKKAVTIGELRAWRRKFALWESMSKGSGQYIDALVFLETDVVQQIKVPVKAKLALPKIVNSDSVEFSLTQKGGKSNSDLIIINPSTQPLAVQLVLSDTPLETTGPIEDKLQEKCVAQVMQYNGLLWKSKKRYLDRKIAEYCCQSVEGLDKKNSSENTSDYFEIEPELEAVCDSLLVFVHGLEPKLDQINQEQVEHENINKKLHRAFAIPTNYLVPTVLPPNAHVKLKHIEFSPQKIGMHEATLFIKNNLTTFQPVKLLGRGGSGIIEFTGSINMYLSKREEIHGIAYDIEPIKPLMFNITLLDVLQRVPESEVKGRFIPMIDGLYELLQIFRFTARQFHERAFTITNRGNLPLIVTGMSIDKKGCTAFGISIYNCMPFVLKTGEVATIFIQYKLTGALHSITRSLVFTTPYGDQAFSLTVTITPDALSVVHRYPQHGKYYFIPFIAIVLMRLM